MFYKGGENCTKLGMQNHCMVKKVGAPDFMYYRLSSKHAILNVCAPGNFLEINKCTTL